MSDSNGYFPHGESPPTEIDRLRHNQNLLIRDVRNIKTRVELLERYAPIVRNISQMAPGNYPYPNPHPNLQQKANPRFSVSVAVDWKLVWAVVLLIAGLAGIINIEVLRAMGGLLK